tara:strand:+ start:15081 stop:16478 length:1398 start_codon:yes stop_codon:yes gene_type:complete
MEVKKTMSNKVITHSRHFNLDEIAAIALLEIYHLEDNYKLIRTRDEKILNQAKKDNNTFVIDVGFEYDDSKLNFDHHQKEMTFIWDNGIPYSSCGLIWKWLKDNNKIDNLNNNQIMKFESKFIRKVDALDNGKGVFPEMHFVTMSNRNHHDDKVIDNHFKRVLKLVKNNISTLMNNIVENKKDIFDGNKGYNKFLDKLTTASLVKNYAFNEKHKMTAEKDKLTFSHPETSDSFVFDFENNTFTHGDNTIPVRTSFTEFSWNLIKSNKKVISQKMNEETISLIEKSIVIPQIQNKQLNKNLCYIVMYEDSKLPAKEAYEAMNGYVMNTFADIRNTLKNNKEINKFVKNSKDLEGIVVCNSNIKNAPNKIAELCPDKTLILIPRDRKSWKIQILPRKDNTFSMPKEWCGLNQKEMKKRFGEDRVIFTHKSGFMCMFSGTKEEAIAFSQELLKNKPKVQYKKRNMRFK